MTTGQDYFEEKHYFQLVNIQVFRHCNIKNTFTMSKQNYYTAFLAPKVILWVKIQSYPTRKNRGFLMNRKEGRRRENEAFLREG